MSANKVGTETRAKVIEYQTECADVLFAHFFGSTALVASADLDTVAETRCKYKMKTWIPVCERTPRARASPHPVAPTPGRPLGAGTPRTLISR